jgi:tetratricopeptide (TPR) repeat protein
MGSRHQCKLLKSGFKNDVMEVNKHTVTKNLLANTLYVTLIFGVLIFQSCKKYLDKKPSKGGAIVSTIQDAQAILDNSDRMNTGYPVLSDIVSDDYYISNSYANSIGNGVKEYVWDKDVTNINNWKQVYVTVYYANFVLKALNIIPVTDVNSRVVQNVKGQALFFRAFAYYHIAQLWCRPYTSSAASDPGIPLRLEADIAAPSVRVSVQATYDQIIFDLKEAVGLLPDNGLAISRPSKSAAFALLARTYLSMRDYVNAGRFADSSLKITNALMNYNSLNAASAAPISRFNPEMVFYAISATAVALPGYSSALIDSTLYQSYGNNDIRKTAFFASAGSNAYSFKGSYDGTLVPSMTFCGIATDEMYLTSAECYARTGLKDSAITVLNRLLVTRWKTGTFVPYIATDNADALAKVLKERREELLFRGIRWMDLRRFNLETHNITLKRVVNGITYTLPPDDPRWVMLIPWEAVNPNSGPGIPQNPR